MALTDIESIIVAWVHDRDICAGRGDIGDLAEKISEYVAAFPKEHVLKIQITQGCFVWATVRNDELRIEGDMDSLSIQPIASNAFTVRARRD